MNDRSLFKQGTKGNDRNVISDILLSLMNTFKNRLKYEKLSADSQISSCNLLTGGSGNLSIFTIELVCFIFDLP
jgi:hypothetical protein